MAAAVNVRDDRLPGPVPVGVNDIASVAVAQQIRVIARVIREISGPGADSRSRRTPFGGSGFGLTHFVVHTAAWVPTIATVAYSSAWLISPCVHSEALT